MTIETRTSYNQTFGDHSVGGLIVTQYIDSKNPNYKTLQESLPSRNMGVSGRFTYAYSDRYFTEFNFGYNASERFETQMGILSVRRWWLDDFERTILPTAQFKNYEIETKSLIRFGGK